MPNSISRRTNIAAALVEAGLLSVLLFPAIAGSLLSKARQSATLILSKGPFVRGGCQRNQKRGLASSSCNSRDGDSL